MILFRRVVLGLLLAGFRMWRRLPPSERRRVMRLARQHGPRVASSLMKRRARARV